MNSDLTKQLVDKFPKLYSKNFHFSVGDGWYGILYDLSAKLSEYIDNADEELLEQMRETGIDFDQTCLVGQCKEKFGSLRYYLNCGMPKEVNDIVDVVEDIAGTICEVCGKEGKMRNGGWIKCLCDEHDENRKK